MKAFVTGADGFIGSHLAERLIELGHDVTALALHTARDSYGWLDGIEVRKVRGDIRDAGLMRTLIRGHDTVFHLAAMGGIPHSYDAPESYVATNISGTLNVLEASRECARFIHTSTSEVYGSARKTPMDETHPLNPQSPYAASKLAADALAQSYFLSFGLPVVTLRPFNTFGPRQSQRAVIPSLIRQALTEKTIKVGDLTTKRDLMFVADTVEAFIAAAEKGRAGQVYNAGTGRSVTIRSVLDYILKEVGPRDIASDPMRARPADSEVRDLVCNAAKLKTDTGWEPKTSLTKGLSRTIEWWRRHKDTPCVIA